MHGVRVTARGEDAVSTEVAATIHTWKPPIDDGHVRLAFSLALDRCVLIDELPEGGGESARVSVDVADSALRGGRCSR
jgi:hypothetical protein